MQRRLAAVLFSDVVRYSELMSRDEARTHELLKSIEKELIAPKAAQYNVRFTRLLGDGQLMEFPSVLEAVEFAVELQLHIRQRNEGTPKYDQIQYRIGINIGDVMVENDDIYGDGVNVAARLESVAEPGGICLSNSAYEQVRDKLDLDFEALGSVELKNISRPVDIIALQLNDKANALISPVVEPDRGSRNLILILHGFGARFDWQTRIPDQLHAHGATDVRLLGYGFLDALLFLIPGLSPTRYFRRTSQSILSARRDYPEQSGSFSVLAYGFATDSVTKALKDNPHLSIDNLLLCGSVVHPHYDWDQVETQIKGKVVNECATRDSGPLVASAFNWGFGATGTYGFSSPKITDRFHAAERKDFLTVDFVNKYWTPFFANNKIVRSEVVSGARQYPGYFPWLTGALRMILGTLAALILLLFAGMMQYANNDFAFDNDNIICKGLRVVWPSSREVSIGAMSQFDKDSGALSKWAIERAIEAVRKEGRYSFQPTLLIRDSKGQKQVALKGLEEFRRARAVAVLGPMGSEMAFHAKKWANRNEIPVLTANASASYLTQEKISDYFFRVSMSDEARVKALVDWMVARTKDLKPYVIHEWSQISPDGSEPEIYGAQQATTAIRHMPSTVQQTTTIRFTRHDKETMNEAVERVENDKNRPIAIFGYTDNIIYIIHKLHARGIENDIYLTGTYNKKIAEAGFPFADNIHIISDVTSEEGYSTTMADFKRSYDSDDLRPSDLGFDVVAAYASDAASILLDAVEASMADSCLGSVDGRLVAQHLRQTRPKVRTIVHTTFLHNRQEVFIPLDRYKIGRDQRLYRFSSSTE